MQRQAIVEPSKYLANLEMLESAIIARKCQKCYKLRDNVLAKQAIVEPSKYLANPSAW